MTTYRKVQTVSFAVLCTLFLMFSACDKKKAETTVTPANPLADSCGDALALNYVAGGGSCTPCQYAVSRYTGQYAIVDTYIFADYYGTTEDIWDTVLGFDTVLVSMRNGNTILFDGLLTLRSYDTSGATTVNTHYTDSLPYSHLSSRSGSSGGYMYFAQCKARGVFRHDSLFFKHENIGSTITDNFKHLGYGVKVN